MVHINTLQPVVAMASCGYGMQWLWHAVVMACAVDILTMHNAGPRLFLCILRFYARSDLSHSVTICHLCQKCHTSNMVSVFMKRNHYQKKNWEKFVILSCLNNTACAHLEVSVSSGPEAHAISTLQKFISYVLGLKSAILNKGLHKNYLNWIEKCWNIWLLHLRGIFVAQRAY